MDWAGYLSSAVALLILAIPAALLRRWRRMKAPRQPSPVADRGPAAPPDTRPYDVFLSHRGPDVKRHFVAFLEEALKRAGVHTFVDQSDLQLGDAAWATMQHALLNAELVMPVFSSGYVESTCCLDELYLATRNPANVLPIFYGIWPGIDKLEKDVRRCPLTSSSLHACTGLILLPHMGCRRQLLSP